MLLGVELSQSPIVQHGLNLDFFTPSYRGYIRMSHIRRKAIEGLDIGDTFSISRTFIEQDVTRFADISRDFNPVHYDERFSKAKNFSGRICHGLLVASMVTEIGGRSDG